MKREAQTMIKRAQTEDELFQKELLLEKSVAANHFEIEKAVREMVEIARPIHERQYDNKFKGQKEKKDNPQLRTPELAKQIQALKKERASLEQDLHAVQEKLSDLNGVSQKPHKRLGK